MQKKVYEKNTWASGDTITSAKLNHMEDGLDTLNYFEITFEFTEIPGYATTDKTLAEIQAAHEAGRKVYLTGEMGDGAIVRVEVTGFVYHDNAVVSYTAVIAEAGDSGPTGVYLVEGLSEEAFFNIIPVS